LVTGVTPTEGDSQPGASRSKPTQDERVTPEQLVNRTDEYLAEHPAAAILGNGRVIFDMRTARDSVTESHGRCVPQLWSEDRNLMRTAVDLQAGTQPEHWLESRLRGEMSELLPGLRSDSV
jgi:hypothetical protein